VKSISGETRGKALREEDRGCVFGLLKLDGLNHLFQHAGSGLPAEYGKLTETFAPEALSAMRDFILGLR
jgi:hypothetical protein